MESKLIFEKLDAICPVDMAEEWDNSGIQIDMGNDVKKLLIALEINNDVLDEALDLNVDMIVTHHPLIFNPMKSVKVTDTEGERLALLIKNDISVYSMHTNFDIVSGGNNDYLGSLIGFTDTVKASPNNVYLRSASLHEPMRADEFARFVCDRLGISYESVRLTGKTEAFVSDVCWCTGAGGDFIEEAAHSGADVYITGDVKYHEARRAEELALTVIDIGHYGSENIFIDNMFDILAVNLPTEIDLIKSESLKSPFISFK